MAEFDIFEDVDVEEEVSIGNDNDKKKAVYLINDDYNTFEHVINCLMQICGYSNEQSLDIAKTVHEKGKCVVAKDRPVSELTKIKLKLELKGLNADLK